MLTAGRNRTGLSERQLSYYVRLWAMLSGEYHHCARYIGSRATSSRTRLDGARNVVLLGADAYRGAGVDANSRISVIACLTHELAHAERLALGYRRPTVLPDVLLDEAETSLHAAFTSVVSRTEREDLVEDARDRLIEWLAMQRQEGRRDES